MIVISTITILKLAETGNYSIGDFEPACRFENTGFGLDISIPSTLHHTYTRHIEEIKANGRHALSSLMVIEKRVVGLTVAVKVGTHERNGFIIGSSIKRICRILVVVTHQHHGIVVYGVVSRYFQSIYSSWGNNNIIRHHIGYCVIHRLFIKSSETIARHCDAILIVTAISHIVIFIAEVSRLGPIGFNGDGSHSIRYFPIGTLAEDTTTHAVEVFICAGTIHKVPVRIVVSIGSKTASTNVAIVDFNNLPACHHTIMGIVARTHLVIVRQLHFLVIEVVVTGTIVIMFKILVSDVECELRGGDRRISIIIKHRPSSTFLYVHRERTQLASFVEMHVVRIDRHSVFSIVIDDGRIIARGFQDGIRSYALVQHPLGNQLRFISIASDVVGRHVACGVKRLAEELETVEETLFGTQGAMIVVVADVVHIITVVIEIAIVVETCI